MVDEGSGRRRSSFAPVVLAGLASAALMAVAASQTWLVAETEGLGRVRSVDIAGSDAAPLALALGLVALAGWGVILVSGTRARRVAAVIGVLASLGVLAVVLATWSDVDAVAARVLADRGDTERVEAGRAAWYWVTGLSAVVQLVPLAATLRSAPQWPTMSSRYDAPTGAAQNTTDASGPTGTADLDLWKALDQGQDPTAGPNP